MRFWILTLVWVTSLLLFPALLLAPLMHGLMILVGREPFEAYDSIMMPASFLLGVGALWVFVRVHCTDTGSG